MHKVKVTTNGNLPSTMIEVDGKPLYVSDFKIEIKNKQVCLIVTLPHPKLEFVGECEMETVDGLSSDK